MSKLKFATLLRIPLYLKIHGPIVGAVSKIRIPVYMAAGLVVIPCFILMVIFSHIVNNPNVAWNSEPKNDDQVLINIEEPPVANVVLPQALPKQNKDIEKESIVSVKSIAGQRVLDFGWQFHPVYKEWRYHTGIDISGIAGQSVQAIASGKVTDIFRDPHSGLTVVVTNDHYSIYYGSLENVNVNKDSIIHVGQLIGTMGRSDAEPYDHLHLAIKEKDHYINPESR